MTRRPTVLITGIGGSIGIDVARSLARESDIRLIGADANPWGRRIGRRWCQKIKEIPRADRQPSEYWTSLTQIIADENVTLSFVNPDPELEALANMRRLPPGRHTLIDVQALATCLDKAATVNWARRLGLGDHFPRTLKVEATEDVERGFDELGSPLWLRATVGPGGRGSLPVHEPGEARAWIRYWDKNDGDHEWMLQELLPGRNYNWTGLYASGEFVADAAMQRLSYFLSDASVSGVSGQVAHCATIDPKRLRRIADQTLRNLNSVPHGLVSVDLREDGEGRPKITEVNPRLAGRPWLYTNAGVNFPLAALRLALREEPGDSVTGFMCDLHMYRQLDVEPEIGKPET